MSNFDDFKVIALAEQAGRLIMRYRGNVTADLKSDDSPVTIADKEASLLIIKGLGEITPDISVISEEAPLDFNLQALQSRRAWRVDPIDGTKSFIDGRDGFGVHIGLIEDDIPIFGVAHFPAQNKTYATIDDTAYLIESNKTFTQIEIPRRFTGMPIAAVDHRKTRRPDTILGRDYVALPGTGGEKICLAAAGEADIVWMNSEAAWAYSQWDVAAAHAILRAAGGELIDPNTGAPISYAREDFSVAPAIGGHPVLLQELGLSLSPDIDKDGPLPPMPFT